MKGMKNMKSLLKTILSVAIIYTIAYFLMLHYHAAPNEVDRYYLLLILFLTLGIGGLYLHEHFFKLFLHLLIPLIISISLYGFVTLNLLNTQYFFNWGLAVALTYVLKGFKWLRRGRN